MEEKNNKRLLIAITFEYIIGLLLTLLMVLYQDSYTLLAFINGMQVAGAFLFIAGWFTYINHHGLFDVVIHGTKAFFKAFTRNPKMDKSIHEIRAARKPMPKYLFISLWINGIIIIAISYLMFYLFI